MYVPPANALPDDDEVRRLVGEVGSAELVTVGPDGFPETTLMPVLWEGDRLVFHMARANAHWQHIADGAPALAIVTGPQAYVSPGWYPSKAEHGRVVPTWNYSAVHLIGHASVHEDLEWLRRAVTDLTDRHEGARAEPWAVTDAPAAYVEGQLRGIVGIEVALTRVEAKAKLSQNRSPADRAGVVEGLTREGGRREQDVAQAMRRS